MISHYYNLMSIALEINAIQLKYQNNMKSITLKLNLPYFDMLHNFLGLKYLLNIVKRDL